MIQKAMLEQAFKAADITTPKMQTAIQDWFALYYNREKTKESDPCQEIAYTIVRKLTKATFAEYKASSSDKFTQRIFDNLNPVRNKSLQLGLIGGSMLLKPIPLKESFIFLPIPRNNVLVFGRNTYGNCSDVGTWECSTYGNQYYTLLERRTIENNKLRIKNRLYKSPDNFSLGQRVPLNSIPQYEQLTDEMVLNINHIGLVEFRTPIENCVDGSLDAVSVYAKAAGLIHNIDHNEALLDGEFDKGQSRLIVSSDMLYTTTEDGERVQQLKDDLFTALDEDPTDMGITIFSPALRDQPHLARKQEYLRNCESIIGLKRGLLADVQEIERTATEIASSDGDYSLTIIDFQQEWEHTVKETVKLCGELGEIYHVDGAKKITDDTKTVIEWGNGVLYDPEADFATDLDLVARGLLKPEIALAKHFKMPYESEADLAAVRAKYMPDVAGMEDMGE